MVSLQNYLKTDKNYSIKDEKTNIDVDAADNQSDN